MAYGSSARGDYDAKSDIDVLLAGSGQSIGWT
jgi:predicted nucleotidyltransferase